MLAASHSLGKSTLGKGCLENQIKNQTAYRFRSRQHSHLIYARKYTRRSTDQIPRNPQDPFEPRRRWQSGADPPRPPRTKEPFDAELLVLFGLPAVIIIIPWAFKDPTALAIIPLALLIPGPRDIILSVLRDFFTGYRKARQFVRPGERDRSRSNSWSRGPPPPPPPRPGAVVYDLDENDFVVDDLIPPFQEEQRYQQQQPPPPSGSTNPSASSSYSNVVEEQTLTPPIPPSAASPSASSTTRTEQYNPPPTASSQQQQQPSPPPPTPSSSYTAENNQNTRPGGSQYRRSSPPQNPRSQQQPNTAHNEADYTRRRRPRGGTTSASSMQNRAVVAASEGSSRLRPGTGRAGRDLVRRSTSTSGKYAVDRRRGGGGGRGIRDVPWYLRPLVVVFPFLKYWGGFM